MVIRHAEKPDSTLNGVKESGDASKHDLIVRGWQRAGALVCFFAPASGPLQSAKLAQPEYLFASNPSKDSDLVGDAASNGESKSHRPEETIKPLSEKLNVQIDLTWSKGQETEVAAAAQACDGVVLIAWQHEAIYKIANAILGNLSAPQTWPRNRFDIVYVFDRDAATGKYSFDQAPQCLLAGDQPEVIQQNMAAVPESVPLNAWSRRRSIRGRDNRNSPFRAASFPSAWFWRIWHAGLFVAYRLDAASVYLGLELRLIDGPPFSKQAEQIRSFFK